MARTASPPPRLALCAAGEIWGGVEQCVYTMARTAAGRPEALLPLALVFHEGLLARRLREIGLPVVVPSGRSRYDPRIVWQMRDALRAHAIEVLHVHGYKATVAGGLAARLAGVKVVKTEHGRLEPPAGWRDLPSHARLRANLLLERAASALLVDALAFVSRDMLRSGANYPARIPRHVVYNGVGPVDGGPARGAQTGGCDVFHVAIVGRIAKVKGHEELIAAAARLRHMPGLKVHVFGSGPLETRCRQLCASLGVADIVEFHGFCPDISRELAHMDLLAIPSRHEGLPYALLEAMRLRVPVLASRVGGLAEVLELEQSGVLVPPGDPRQLAEAIERLRSDPARRVRIADRAYRQAQRMFTAEAMQRGYAAIYASLVRRA